MPKPGPIRLIRIHPFMFDFAIRNHPIMGM